MTEVDGDTPAAGEPLDSASGTVRVLSAKCSTCIYRRGNLMHLTEGRQESMAAEAIATGSWIVCHQTLAYYRDDNGNAPEVPPSVCRGYSDAERRTDGEHRAAGMQLAERLGVVSEVDPPIS